ncbi:uncharacterized protein IUM83_14257 [Phytophthora cinnamomi]|uniref:uncharacterized protein n=1 Tax=Phytophthora cinnamomi TaxID=4785 RepID=UPI00355A7EF1|nr:hypothetical protein IUM83_14257 [Phytophthora cinnamomi]
MLLVDKRPPPSLPSRKRKMVVLGDDCREKRARCSGAWTELEYEMVMEEATLLREELELLLFVAADLCRDLRCDDAPVRSFAATLEQVGELLAAPQPLTVPQIREMCQQMLAMMQYLCRVHYSHFALVDMQDQLRECRNRFMLFICKNAAMIGL